MVVVLIPLTLIVFYTMITNKTFCSTEKMLKNVIINNVKHNNVGIFSSIEVELSNSGVIKIHSLDSGKRELIAEALFNKYLFPNTSKIDYFNNEAFITETKNIGCSLGSIYITDKLIQLKFNIKESDLNLDLLLETIERHL